MAGFGEQIVRRKNDVAARFPRGLPPGRPGVPGVGVSPGCQNPRDPRRNGGGFPVFPPNLMTPDSSAPSAARKSVPALVFFGLCLLFHLRGTSVGWQSQQMPGNEFRQSQTAITAYYVQQDNDFSL